MMSVKRLGPDDYDEHAEASLEILKLICRSTYCIISLDGPSLRRLLRILRAKFFHLFIDRAFESHITITFSLPKCSV